MSTKTSNAWVFMSTTNQLLRGRGPGSSRLLVPIEKKTADTNSDRWSPPVMLVVEAACSSKKTHHLICFELLVKQCVGLKVRRFVMVVSACCCRHSASLKFLRSLMTYHENWIPLTTTTWNDEEGGKSRRRRGMDLLFPTTIVLIATVKHNPFFLSSFVQSLSRFSLSLLSHPWPLKPIHSFYFFTFLFTFLPPTNTSYFFLASFRLVHLSLSTTHIFDCILQTSSHLLRFPIFLFFSSPFDHQ